MLQPESFTLPNDFIREHHDASSTWQKVKLRSLQDKIEEFKNEYVFELIVKKLGVKRLRKERIPVRYE